MFKRMLSLTVIVCFFLTTLSPYPQAHADTVLGLPTPGTMVNLSPAYEPALIKGLTVHKDNPFLFNFIVDSGNSAITGDELKKEGDRLVKYFFACLTIPEKDLWVNLSPFEKDKMVSQALGQTALGRDLLAQDYILKQLTASLIYPEKDLGKTFWDRVYAKAQLMYGTAQIPVNTFNKVWIVADKASVFEHGQTAFVMNGHLKVMLEEDYLALQKHNPSVIPNASSVIPATSTVIPAKAGIHSVGSQIVREIILPEIEKEVNTGKNFSTLRQIFNSLILASWYKKDFKEALLTQVYADKSTVKGVKMADPSVKEQIYQQYLKAYKQGVFNYIKEDNRPDGQTIPRKYFSGGFDSALVVTVDKNPADATQVAGPTGNMSDLSVGLEINNPNPIANPAMTTPNASMTRKKIFGIAINVYEGRFPSYPTTGMRLLAGLILKDDAKYTERVKVLAEYVLNNHPNPTTDMRLLAGLILKDDAKYTERVKVLAEYVLNNHPNPTTDMRLLAGLILKDDAKHTEHVKSVAKDVLNNHPNPTYGMLLLAGLILKDDAKYTERVKMLAEGVIKHQFPSNPTTDMVLQAGLTILELPNAAMVGNIKDEISALSFPMNRRTFLALGGLSFIGFLGLVSPALGRTMILNSGTPQLTENERIATDVANEILFMTGAHAQTITLIAKTLANGLDNRIPDQTVTSLKAILGGTQKAQNVAEFLTDATFAIKTNPKEKVKEAETQARQIKSELSRVNTGRLSTQIVVALRTGLLLHFIPEVKENLTIGYLMTVLGEGRGHRELATMMVNAAFSIAKGDKNLIKQAEKIARKITQELGPLEFTLSNQIKAVLRTALLMNDKDKALEYLALVLGENGTVSYRQLLTDAVFEITDNSKSKFEHTQIVAQQTVEGLLPGIGATLKKRTVAAIRTGLLANDQAKANSYLITVFGNSVDQNERDLLIHSAFESFKLKYPDAAMLADYVIQSQKDALRALRRLDNSTILTAIKFAKIGAYVGHGPTLPEDNELMRAIRSIKNDPDRLDEEYRKISQSYTLNYVLSPGSITAPDFWIRFAENIIAYANAAMLADKLNELMDELSKETTDELTSMRALAIPDVNEWLEVRPKIYNWAQRFLSELKTLPATSITAMYLREKSSSIGKIIFVTFRTPGGFMDYRPVLTLGHFIAMERAGVKTKVPSNVLGMTNNIENLIHKLIDQTPINVNAKVDAAMLGQKLLEDLRIVVQLIDEEDEEVLRKMQQKADQHYKKYEGEQKEYLFTHERGYINALNAIKNIYSDLKSRLAQSPLTMGGLISLLDRLKSIFEVTFLKSSSGYSAELSFRTIDAAESNGSKVALKIFDALMQSIRNFENAPDAAMVGINISMDDHVLLDYVMTMLEDRRGMGDLGYPLLSLYAGLLKLRSERGKLSHVVLETAAEAAISSGANIENSKERSEFFLKSGKPRQIVYSVANAIYQQATKSFNELLESSIDTRRKYLVMAREIILNDAAMKTDHAALAKDSNTEAFPGGIDLNTANGMQWKVSKDGQGVEMNIDPAMIERVKREGINSLSPVIFKITPVNSIWPLLGLQVPAKDRSLAGV